MPDLTVAKHKDGTVFQIGNSVIKLTDKQIMDLIIHLTAGTGAQTFQQKTKSPIICVE